MAKTLYGIRVRKTSKQAWKRVRTLKNPQGVWGTKAVADKVLANLKKKGYAGHVFAGAKALAPLPKPKPKPAPAKPKTLAQKAYAEATKSIGIMERGGNNRGPAVERIIRANGGVPGEPWCGDFVAYCYKNAGSGAVRREWAAVRFLGYLPGQRIVSSPTEGDIVCFNFDHTGLFGYYCDSRGRARARSVATHICTIEGNTGATGAVSDSATGGDGVYRKIRSRSLVSRYVHVTR